MLTNLDEMELGTNPYIKDSDFDGISDSDDIEPLNTNVSSEETVCYDVSVQEGMFDLVTAYIDSNGNRCRMVYNYLTGQSKLSVIGDEKRTALYDGEGNITAYIEYIDDKYAVNTYTYDNGNIIAVAHNGFQYIFEYDESGNVIAIKIGDRTLSSRQYANGIVQSEILGNGWNTECEYDENGNIISYSENGKRVCKWTYDEAGRELSSTDLAEGITYTYEYDDMGMISAIKADNGVTISYEMSEESYTVAYSIGDMNKEWSMDISGEEEITEIENTDVDESEKIDIQYSYDDNGNIETVIEGGEEKVYYTYDGFNQLIREDNLYIGKSITYSYDNAGNILDVNEYAYTKMELGEIIDSKEYLYNDNQWKDILTSYNGETITYDEIGNPLSYRNGMEFSWNGKRLADVTTQENIISYTYNCDGIRTSRTVNGEKTEYYLEGSRIIAEKKDEEIIWYTYNSEGDVIGFEYQNEIYSYEKNAQDDIIGIIDKDGNIICRYIYDTWGDIVAIEGDKKIADVNPFRYRCYYFDTETNLYYIESRYYDPTTGRFISADMLINNGEGILGSNMYAYCVNNPVNMKDVGGYTPSYIINEQTENSTIYGIKFKYIPVGLLGNLAKNGCGAIAAYNVLLSNGIFTTIFEVLSRITLYGGINALGLGGITPGSIALLMLKYFYIVKMYNSNTSKWIADQALYEAVIVLFITTNSGIGMHYIAGIKTETPGMYRFYNTGLENARGDSINGWKMHVSVLLNYIKSNKCVPFLMMGIAAKKR